MSEANKRTLLTLNQVVWNTGDVSRIGDFIHEDFIADYRPQGSLHQGLEDARKMVRGAHETFQDFHEEMHDVLAEGVRPSGVPVRCDKSSRRSDCRAGAKTLRA